MWESAIGFGRAAGLPRQWLNNIFAFAPAPGAMWRVPEGSAAVNGRTGPADSFLEFSLAQFARRARGCGDTEIIRSGFHYHLEQLEARGKCKTAGEAP